MATDVDATVRQTSDRRDEIFGPLSSYAWGTVNMKPVKVVAVTGDADVDHAIATLVLAFGTDPVARWIYDDPDHYLKHIPRLFRALGTSSFAAGAAQRTADGLGVALWLPPGIHGEDEPLEAIIAETIAAEKQADVGAAFERTEQYRLSKPIGACRL